MAYKLFESLVKHEGFCCNYGYIYSHRLWNTARLAKHLGISDRGLRYWKRKVKLGKCTCRNKTHCPKQNCAKLMEPVPK